MNDEPIKTGPPLNPAAVEYALRTGPGGAVLPEFGATLEVAVLRTMTVTVGPFPIYFGNVNVAMGLRGHHHTGAVTLEYVTPVGEHGYPSFRETNDAIRERLEQHTGARNTFRDATNEDVAERLFDLFDGWVHESWEQYGGQYALAALHLDVEGVHDDIGHDAGVTRYTLRQGVPW